VQTPAVLKYHFKVKCRPLTDSEEAQEDNKVLRVLNPVGTFQMMSLQGIEGVLASGHSNKIITTEVDC
jgi:hypothetical protein